MNNTQTTAPTAWSHQLYNYGSSLRQGLYPIFGYPADQQQSDDDRQDNNSYYQQGK